MIRILVNSYKGLPMKKLFFLFVAICGMLANAETIKIGIVLPISGAVGGFGELGKRGIDLAYATQNKTKNGRNE